MDNTQVRRSTMKEEMIENLQKSHELLPAFIALVNSAEEDDNIHWFIIEGVKAREFRVHMETFLKQAENGKASR